MCANIIWDSVLPIETLTDAQSVTIEATHWVFGDKQEVTLPMSGTVVDLLGELSRVSTQWTGLSIALAKTPDTILSLTDDFFDVFKFVTGPVEDGDFRVAVMFLETSFESMAKDQLTMRLKKLEKYTLEDVLINMNGGKIFPVEGALQPGNWVRGKHFVQQLGAKLLVKVRFHTPPSRPLANIDIGGTRSHRMRSPEMI